MVRFPTDESLVATYVAKDGAARDVEVATAEDITQGDRLCAGESRTKATLPASAATSAQP